MKTLINKIIEELEEIVIDTENENTTLSFNAEQNLGHAIGTAKAMLMFYEEQNTPGKVSELEELEGTEVINGIRYKKA